MPSGAADVPPTPTLSGTPTPTKPSAMSLQLQLELIDLQLAIDRGDDGGEVTVPVKSSATPSSSRPASAPAALSRRAAKRRARADLRSHRRREGGAEGGAGAEAGAVAATTDSGSASPSSSSFFSCPPAVPKQPPGTGSDLHDSLIGADWAAAERHLAAEGGASAARLAAAGVGMGSRRRNRGRGVGLLPLHLAIMYGAPDSMVLRLIKAHPRAARKAVNAAHGRVHGRALLPLHMAMLRRSSSAIVAQLLASFAGAAQQPCELDRRYRGMLALHLCVMSGSGASVARQVLAAYPDAIRHRCYRPAVSSWSVSYGGRLAAGACEPGEGATFLPIHLAALVAAAVRSPAASLTPPCVHGENEDTPLPSPTHHGAPWAAAQPEVLRLLLSAWPEGVAEVAPRTATGSRFANDFLVDACPLHLAVVVGARRAPDSARCSCACGGVGLIRPPPRPLWQRTDAARAAGVAETARMLLTALPTMAQRPCTADIVADRRLAVHIRQRPNSSPYIVARLLPIHLALIHRAPPAVVDMLLRTSALSARLPAQPRYSREDCDVNAELYNRTRVMFVLGTGPVTDHLPLHMAVLGGAPVRVISALLQRAPETAMMGCRPFYEVDCEGARGCLPLHLALFKHAETTVIQALLTASASAASTCLEEGVRGLASVLPLHIALLVGSPLSTLYALLRSHPAAASTPCWLRKWEHRVMPLAIARNGVASFPVPAKSNSLYLWRPSHGRPFDKAAAADAAALLESIELHSDCDVTAVVRALEFFQLKSLSLGEMDVVRVLQTRVLGWLYRLRFVRLRAFTIMLQAKARRTMLQLNFLRKKRLTCFTQATRRRVGPHRDFQQLKRAAIQTQSVRRGVLAVACRNRRLAAMHTMQRVLRGALYRRQHLQSKHAALSIAAVARGHRLRKYMAAALVMQSVRRCRGPHQHFRDMKRACIRIQSARRKACAVHYVRVRLVVHRSLTRALQQRSAITMQQHARRWLAVRTLIQLRNDGAATYIQASARRRQASRRHAAFHLVDAVFRRCAALVIQKYARQLLARKFVERMRSALQIQCARRRMVAVRSKHALRLVDTVWERAVNRHAATTLQQRHRGRLGRRAARQAKIDLATFTRRTLAAVKLQCAARRMVTERVALSCRVVDTAWVGATRSYAVAVLQGAVRQLIARRRKEEAIVARDFHQKAVNGSSLIELITAIKAEIGLDTGTKPRMVIAQASEFLDVTLETGLTMLEQAQTIAAELGLDVELGMTGTRGLRAELQRLRRDGELGDQQDVNSIEEAPETVVAPAAIDMLLWESDDAHVWWWRASSDADRPDETVDPKRDWRGRDAYDSLVPYNGWKKTDVPIAMRELLDHWSKLRISDMVMILKCTALNLQGRKSEIDAISLLAKLLDLDVPKKRHKMFLKGFEYLLVKAGREDSSPERLSRCLAPLGIQPVHVDTLFKTIEWVSSERSQILSSAAALHAAEAARREAEEARLAQVERARQAWLRAQAALGALNASEDILLDEALRRLYVSLESRPQAMAALKKYDTHGGGYLLLEEYRNAFRDLHLHLSEEQTSLVLSVLDVDHSGRISIEDFCDLVYVVKLDRVQKRFEQAEERQIEWAHRQEAATQMAAAKAAQLARHRRLLDEELSKDYVDPVVAALETAKAAVPVPEKLRPIVDALPVFDKATLKYLLQAAALRLQSRVSLIDTDDLLEALAPSGSRQQCLESIEFLLQKSSRPEVSEDFLRSTLGSLGFEAFHLEALFEALEWIKAGAAGEVVSPKRQAIIAQERQRQMELEQTEFEKRVAAEVARRTENMVPITVVAGTSQPQPPPTETPQDGAHDAAPEAVVVPAVSVPAQEPPDPVLVPLIEQLPTLRKSAMARLLQVVAMDMLGRDDESTSESPLLLECLEAAGIQEELHDALKRSATHLLQPAVAAAAAGSGGGGAAAAAAARESSQSRELRRHGFRRRHLLALSETTSWIADGAAIFDRPEINPDASDDEEEEEEDEEESGSLGQPAAMAQARSGPRSSSVAPPYEKVRPPPDVADAVMIAPWLDLPTWNFVLQAAALQVARCSRPTLRLPARTGRTPASVGRGGFCVSWFLV
jgi:hypothetical protein